jgi:acyl phosphate:glycerol-3-phosphate acyltransferase
MHLIILILASYLAGSIPTSIVLGKLFRGVDVREHGSRNPGATNTFRVLGWKIGIAVGLIDIFKGFFAVWFLTRWIADEGLVSPDVRLILAGIAAVCGHVFTVFASFKGGKGVSTAFGVFLGLAPLPSAIAFVVWALLVWLTGYVAVGSIAAAVVLPALVIGRGLHDGLLSLPIAALATLLGLLVIYRHRSNIGRLMRGEENRFNTRRFS